MNSIFAKSFVLLLLFIGPTTFAQSEPKAPINHVLLIEWVENPDSLAQEEIYSLFKELPQKIEGFRSVQIKPIILSNHNFDEVIIMVFDHQMALDAYQEHPDHLSIKKLAKPNLVKLTKFDYAD